MVLGPDFDYLGFEERLQGTDGKIKESQEVYVPYLRWCSNIFQFSGYARHSREILLSLDRRAVPLSIQPLTPDEAFLAYLKDNPGELRTWKRLVGRQVEKGVYVCHHTPILWDGTDVFASLRRLNPGFDAYVGFTTFETDRLPVGWAEACNGMDEIWVPSSFNRETFAGAGVDPDRIQVIPFGLDVQLYDPARVQPMDISGRRGFAFLSVFQWNKRKGWDVLLRSYLAAFTPQDDVCLILRTYPDAKKTPPIRERVSHYLRELGYDPERVPPIILVEGFVPDAKMPPLYAAAQAFVLPTRGEGLGIPFMEAMAMGLPVIGTRWSGHLDFMNDENSYLIDIDGLVPVDPEQAEENPFYTRDQRWAEPSLDHTVALLRRVYEHYEEARAKGIRARQEITRQWTPDRTVDRIIERAAFLSRKAGRRKARTAEGKTGEVPRPQHTSGPSLLWHAPMLDPSGYADEARQFVLGLDSKGVRVRAVPITWSHVRAELPEEVTARLKLLTATDVSASHGPVISVFHIFPPYFQRVPEADYHVGRTMFETDRIPEGWVRACNQMDEIWVPSDFNIESFSRSGVPREKLVKIPEGIDITLYRPDSPPLHPNGRGRFTFLSVFDWSRRKGWDLLLRAFLEEFRPEEDIMLLLKVWSSLGRNLEQIREEALAFVRQAGLANELPSNVVFYEANLPAQDLPRLYRAADAFVLPTRGEGWGRPFMEAMLMELPVIGTRWSGHLEFMNEDNAYLVECQLVDVEEEAWREVPTFRGHRWAEPSVDHLRQLMRQVVEDRENARRKGRAGREEILTRFSKERVAELVKYRVEVITERLKCVTRLSSVSGIASPKFAIRWEGDQFAHHSLAVVNRELCLQLIGAGHEVSITPCEPNQFGPEVDERFYNLAERFLTPLSRSADVHVRHQWPPDLNPPPEGHWVIIQPWEFGTIPRRWVEVFSTQVDEIWVPSHYVRNCYILSGVPADRVYVVPNGVDPHRFHPEAPPLDLSAFGTVDKTFRFLFVGGTILRKGIDVLLQAYTKAFTRADDVCLVIKGMGNPTLYRGKKWEQAIRKLQDTPDAPVIVYIDQDLSPNQLPGLYTSCHCLVHPYRGEGFGLPIAEAMACGLPVIVTGYGAAMDFCNEETAYLTPAVVCKATAPDLMAQEPIGNLWIAEVDIEALARLMRFVYEHRKEAQARGIKASQRIRAELTWERAAEAAMARIRALREQPIRRYQQVAPGAVEGAIQQGPLTLVETRSVHLLMMPDWNDSEDRWRDAIRAFLSEFGPSEDVGLIIRVDPLETPNQEALLERIQRWANGEGIDLDSGPMILVLNDLIDPTRRDLLYGTAQILIDLSSSVRGKVIRSEAVAHGLIICRPTGSDMRAAWSEIKNGSWRGGGRPHQYLQHPGRVRAGEGNY